MVVGKSEAGELNDGTKRGHVRPVPSGLCSESLSVFAGNGRKSLKTLCGRPRLRKMASGVCLGIHDLLVLGGLRLYSPAGSRWVRFFQGSSELKGDTQS